MVSTKNLTDVDRDSLTQWAQGFSGQRVVIVTGLHSIVEDIVASHLEERAAAIEARRVHIHAVNESACEDGCGWLDFAARIVREGGIR